MSKVLTKFKGIKKITINQYYDLHGQIIPQEKVNFYCEPEDEITIESSEHTILGSRVDMWFVGINGEEKSHDWGEITGYRRARGSSTLELDACTGAG